MFEWKCEVAGEWESSGLRLRAGEPGCGLRGGGSGRGGPAGGRSSGVGAESSCSCGQLAAQTGAAGGPGKGGTCGSQWAGPAAGGGAGSFRPGGTGRGAARRNAPGAAGVEAPWHVPRVTPLSFPSCDRSVIGL